MNSPFRSEPLVLREIAATLQICQKAEERLQRKVTVFDEDLLQLRIELTRTRLFDLGATKFARSSCVDWFIDRLISRSREGDDFLATNQYPCALEAYTKAASEQSGIESLPSGDSLPVREVNQLVDTYLLLLAHRFDEAQRRLAEVCVPENPLWKSLRRSLEREVRKGQKICALFRANANWSHARGMRALLTILDGMQEQYGAAEVSLYVVERDKIRPLASTMGHRNDDAQIPETVLEAIDQGEFIDQRLRERPGARVEVALPIFDVGSDANESMLSDRKRRSGSKAVGALYLRPHPYNVFSPGSVSEMRTAALDCLPDLLAFRSRVPSRFGDWEVQWHYREHAWDLSDVLSQYCHRISSILARKKQRPPSFTVWHHDKQWDHLWARATVHYDYAYLCESLLPIAYTVAKSAGEQAPSPLTPSYSLEQTSPESSVFVRFRRDDQHYPLCKSTQSKTQQQRRLEAQSLPFRFSMTGRALLHDRGEVTSGELSDLPDYYRQDRAPVRELHRLSSLPIFEPDAANPSGCLNSYSFLGSTPTSIHLLRLCADLLGEQIGQYSASVTRIVQAWVSKEIAQRKRMSAAETIRFLEAILRTLLDAPACSIFVLEPNGKKLTCVATTGLEKELGDVIYQLDEASYDLDADKDSMTTSLALEPDSVYRNNFVPPHGAVKEHPTKHVRVSRKFVESLPATDSHHRRVLARSSETTSNDHSDENQPRCSIAVIRFIRSSDQRPFLEHDELILKGILRAASPLFQDWRAQVRTSAKTKLQGTVMSTINAAEQQHATQRQIRALRSLFVPVPSFYGRQRNFVNEVLQEVLMFFAPQGAIQCSLREAVRQSQSLEVLRVRGFQSTITPEYPDEARYRPSAHERHEPGKGIAWRALGRKSIDSQNQSISSRPPGILTFDFQKNLALKKHLFEAISDGSEKVQSGVCIPFGIAIGSQMTDWVMCLDFQNSFEWQGPQIGILLRAVNKLSAIISDTVVPSYENGAQCLSAFLVRSVRDLDSRQGRLQVVFDNNKASMIDLQCKLPSSSLPDGGGRRQFVSQVNRNSLRAEPMRDSSYWIQRKMTSMADKEFFLSLMLGPSAVGRLYYEFERQTPPVDALNRQCASILGKWSKYLSQIEQEAEGYRWQVEIETQEDDNFPGLRQIVPKPKLIQMKPYVLIPRSQVVDPGLYL